MSSLVHVLIRSLELPVVRRSPQKDHIYQWGNGANNLSRKRNTCLEDIENTIGSCLTNVLRSFHVARKLL